MSIEEAIKLLSEFRQNHTMYGYEHNRNIDEAVEMAINALETSCDNCPLSEELPTIPPLAKGGSAENGKLYIEGEHETELLPTIPQTDLPDILIKEYLSKCECCDECFAEYFCIKNDLRESREPKDYCVENIRQYLSLRTNTIPQTDSVLEKIKEEIETLVEAEQQVYGKGSWNFTKKCLDIIDKHISGKEYE